MSDPYLLKLIPLMQVRVRAIECAGKNTGVGTEKHIEAIAQGLSFARDPLRYATRSLWTAGNSKIKEQQHQAIHKQFMCGLFFLMSALDAMVVVDASSVDDLSAEMNFFSTPLSFFLSWFTDSLVQQWNGRVSGQWDTEESPRLLGSGVRFLAVGYVGRIRAGVGFLAVVYVGRIRAWVGGEIFANQ